MRFTGDDLVRQKFAGDQAERCTAVSEGNVETAHIINAAEYGLAVAGNRLGPEPVPGGRELRLTFQDTGGLGEQ